MIFFLLYGRISTDAEFSLKQTPEELRRNAMLYPEPKTEGKAPEKEKPRLKRTDLIPAPSKGGKSGSASVPALSGKVPAELSVNHSHKRNVQFNLDPQLSRNEEVDGVREEDEDSLLGDRFDDRQSTQRLTPPDVRLVLPDRLSSAAQNTFSLDRSVQHRPQASLAREQGGVDASSLPPFNEAMRRFDSGVGRQSPSDTGLNVDPLVDVQDSRPLKSRFDFTAPRPQQRIEISQDRALVSVQQPLNDVMTGLGDGSLPPPSSPPPLLVQGGASSPSSLGSQGWDRISNGSVEASRRDASTTSNNVQGAGLGVTPEIGKRQTGAASSSLSSVSPFGNGEGSVDGRSVTQNSPTAASPRLSERSSLVRPGTPFNIPADLSRSVQTSVRGYLNNPRRADLPQALSDQNVELLEKMLANTITERDFSTSMPGSNSFDAYMLPLVPYLKCCLELINSTTVGQDVARNHARQICQTMQAIIIAKASRGKMQFLTLWLELLGYPLESASLQLAGIMYISRSQNASNDQLKVYYIEKLKQSIIDDTKRRGCKSDDGSMTLEYDRIIAQIKSVSFGEFRAKNPLIQLTQSEYDQALRSLS